MKQSNIFKSAVRIKHFENLNGTFYCIAYNKNLFCFADDKDVELTKKMDEACSAEQMAKTGTVKCQEAKDNLLKYINTELPELKNNYQIKKDSIKQLAKDKNLKCSESGLTAYGSEGCKDATEQFNSANNYITKTKAKIEKLETLKSNLTN